MHTADTPLTNAWHDPHVVPVHFLLLDPSSPAHLCLYLAVKVRDQILPPSITPGKVINLFDECLTVHRRHEESKTNSMLHNGLLDLMNRSTCFGRYYAHHQELATIQMLYSTASRETSL